MPAELFDSITHEMMFDGENWTDMGADVDACSWNRGIMSNHPNARIANRGVANLMLNNSASNSQTQAGAYSPGNSNVRSGFGKGIRYRLSFVKDGKTFYKFHGRIKTIFPIPGTKGERQTRVTIHDYMGIVYDHELNLLEIAESKTIDEVMPLIVSNMAIEPLSTSYAVGKSEFPTVFDTTRPNTRAAAEFKKLAMSEQCTIYVRGNQTDGETLVNEHRNTRSEKVNTPLIISGNEAGFLLKEDGDFLLKEDGDKIILDQVQTASFDNVMLPGSRINHGKNIFNFAKSRAYPREVGGSNEVLYTLNTVISLQPGENKTGVRGSYRDPGGSAVRVNGKDMVTPVASTDYTANTEEGGGGSDITSDLTIVADYGVAGVEYTTMQNNGTVLMYITKLQARGIKILLFDPTDYLKEDSASQLINGVLPIRLDLKYQDDPLVAEAFSDDLIARRKDARVSGDSIKLNTGRSSMEMYGFLQLAEPGERGEFIEDLTGMSGDWFVNGYRATIIAGKYVEYSLILIEADLNAFWLWDTSKWDETTAWGFPED
jgi:hypothetical protein